MDPRSKMTLDDLAAEARGEQEERNDRLARALALLREVEWGAGGDFEGACLFCLSFPIDEHGNVGHAPDCALAKLLEEEE